MSTKKIRERTQNLSPKQRQLLALKLNKLKEAAPDNGEESHSKNLIAYVKGNPALDKSDLSHFIKDKLPEYMIPAHIVILDDFPRLPNGKVDRKNLPDPDQFSTESESTYVKARNSLEEKLVEIWEEVLGFQPIGVQDNFFEIGGDSILSIQINGKARKAGIILAPNQIFEYQTIAELVLYAQEETSENTTNDIFVGPVKMLPIQYWFFEEHQAAPHHWNQTVMFDIDKKISTEHIQKAIDHLIHRHDALRLSFSSGSGKWEASLLDPEKINAFEKTDISQLSKEAQNDSIEKIIASVQSGFDLAEGRLFKVVYIHCGSTQNDKLFLIAHHLLVDNVSWQIITEDISSAITQLNQNNSIALPSHTISYKDWGEHLAEQAISGSLEAEYDFWQNQMGTSTDFPADFKNDLPAHEASIETFVLELDTHITQNLLNEAGKTYNTRTHEMLIAALMISMQSWKEITTLCLGLEGHGRGAADESIDFSRSVGWFTTYYPVTLEVDVRSDIGNTLKSIKEKLRSVPKGGISYGVYRYLNDDTIKIEKPDQRPPIIFNYLGIQNDLQSDVLGKGQTIFNNTRSEKSERYHLLEINASVRDKKLIVNCGYSKLFHETNTIEILMQNFEKAIRDLIHHCLSAEKQEYTPSDFPDADINQEDLDKLLGQINI